ncbi:MAG TPA: HepT-like ribonuclease domain-containing protein [Rubrivivax sp.]|nr:HepT-like ribonuclease domain-containing protein [Rubrivivax sp.]
MALRNLLVHAYADIDDRIVWGVVTVQLARLVAELDAL